MKTIQGSFIWLLLGCLVLSLVACSRKEIDQPQPPVLPTSTYVLPSDGAPKVEQPLDTATINPQPCSVATKEQVESLGEVVDEIRSEPDSGIGPSCVWNLQTPGLIRAGIPRDSQTIRGLSDIYAKQKSEGFPSFEPIVVAGYPAVIFNRSESGCAITLGLRDNQVYGISVIVADRDSPNHGHECEMAAKFGEFVIATLKERTPPK